MDGDLRLIASLLREAMSDTANLAGPGAQAQMSATTVVQGLGDVEAKLNHARGAGLTSNRMDSTLLLLREIREKGQELAVLAEQQRARLASLHAGIGEILGE